MVWNPLLPGGGLTAEQLRDARVILWKGHCSVHGRFSVDVVDQLRRTIPGVRSWSIPSAVTRWSPAPTWWAPRSSSSVSVEAARAGSSWAIGTELNLVKRLADAHPDQGTIVFLDRTVCYCSTMNRIDLPASCGPWSPWPRASWST